MRWFGRSWGAAICRQSPRVATPAGQACLTCGEPIGAGDNGIVMPYLGRDAADCGERPQHLECHMRGFIGGANHLIGRCTCCGGDAPPDPPGLTVREAARVAVRKWSEMECMPPPPFSSL